MIGRSLPGTLPSPSQEEIAKKDNNEHQDVELIIHIDRALGLSSNMTFKHGSPIKAIKEQLAQADPTGMTKPNDLGLKMPGSDLLLNDTDPIIAAMVELEVCLA